MQRDLDTLHAFYQVARLRSFRQAAVLLAVSPSALSHAISRLEQDLGVRLLNRTTRSVSPTPAGARLLERLGPALADIDLALDSLHDERAQLRGRIRLNLPRSATQLVLAPRLAEWTRRYPGVELDVTSNDGVVDIVEQGFDAGMRFGELLQQDMVALPVGPAMRFVTCAAPAYLAAAGEPRTPDQLPDHQCLQIRFPSGALYRWDYLHEGRPMAIATRGALVLDDLPAILRAAVDGAGICYTYHALARPYLEDGRLRTVLAAFEPPPERFHLYYPSGRNMPARLRALVDFLKDEG
jgi:DNA-binding transcriptional LysR family regulator